MYDVIDLHLMSDDIEYHLQTQLDIFESELDKALVRGLNEFRVIHGIGEGVLKREVHEILKNHPHVLEYKNEYHPLYGIGSTKIIFK
jgi:dsDNA-specific endonuclease/ATPase MutS2